MDGTGVLILIGLAVFGGMLGAAVFQRLRIPQVVGYICIGVLIGQSGFKFIQAHDIEALRPLNLFALGIIGFLVGGEIQIATLRQYAKQFTAILLAEGLLAFLLVGAASFGILAVVTDDLRAALAGAVVLGAIASATDPASTIDVLWENRAQGILTTSIIAIVALDDALAMTLYGLGTGVADILAGGHSNLFHALGKVAFELVGAVVLGCLSALVLNLFLRWMRKPDHHLSLAVGLLLLTIGIAASAGMDVILASMSMGMALTNLAPRRSRQLFETARGFAVPIYVLFFVFVGARLGIGNMQTWMWGLVVAYVACRSVGKIGGAYIAARATGSEDVIRKYLGTGLFAQGGVAVGLSIMASHHLQGITLADGMSLGDVIIFTVTATTLIVQISGPPLVKWVIRKSGEAGRKITEEDVIDTLKVRDVMTPSVLTVREANSVRQVVEMFSVNDQMVYPVVNGEHKVIGVVSPEELKDVLVDQDSWDWLVATDVMRSTADTSLEDAPLRGTMGRMLDMEIDHLPVIESDENPRAVGILSSYEVRKRVSAELLKRRQYVAP